MSLPIYSKPKRAKREPGSGFPFVVLARCGPEGPYVHSVHGTLEAAKRFAGSVVGGADIVDRAYCRSLGLTIGAK